MKVEDRILCAAVRQAFLPAHREAVETLARRRPVRWERLAESAVRHGVAPIVWTNLRRCDPAALRLPAPVAGRLEHALFEGVARAERDAVRLMSALARLDAVGQDALVLKGTAARLLVYDQPWATVSRDIDLTVRPRPGRSFGPEEREVRLDLYLDGIECEPLEHHDVTMNGALAVPFERIWREARRVEVRGAPALVPAAEDLVLTIAIGCCRKRYFRLKTLFDLAESVARLPLDWERLAAAAREARCEAVVWTALAAARATVGCEVPESAMATLGVPVARRLVLEALVAAAVALGPLAAPAPGVRSTPGPSLLLTYTSLHLDQAWRSARVALAKPTLEEHRAGLEALAARHGRDFRAEA